MRMMPTRTCRGWMSPDECVPGGCKAELESGSKRVRRQRALTNASSPGEIHLVEKSVVPSLLDAPNYVLMSIALTIDREPETYQESLPCAEAPEWRRARKRKCDALLERHAMLTPPGARPTKSRDIYKRKYYINGTVKKYKARSVALGCGQVSGVCLIHLNQL